MVFEDVWKEHDDEIFENQLRSLADYIIDNKLYNSFYCSLFSDSIGGFVSRDTLNRTYCGAGKMIAIGPDGKLYPCLRYKDYSLNHKREWSIGDVNSGINMEKVRPFIVAEVRYQHDSECLTCNVAAGCPECQGLNYDNADTDTNFQHAKYICKMQKARVRANNYYFARLFNKFGIERISEGGERSKMYFLLSENFMTYCCYNNKSNSNMSKRMNTDTILAGLQYCHESFYDPIFVHSSTDFDYSHLPQYDNYIIQHIVPAKFYKEASANLKNILFVFEKDTYNLPLQGLKNCILNVEQSDIINLHKYVCTILSKTERLNLNILDLDKNFNEDTYEKQLSMIKDDLISTYRSNGVIKEVNVITDLCFVSEFSNCKAGERSFVYTPDGNFYTCSGIYKEQLEHAAGNPSKGISLKNSQLYTMTYNPICNVCDAYQCRNCIFINQYSTNEVNVSSSFQCRKSHIERAISKEYQKSIGQPAEQNPLKAIDYLDPVCNVSELQESAQKPYYKYAK